MFRRVAAFLLTNLLIIVMLGVVLNVLVGVLAMLGINVDMESYGINLPFLFLFCFVWGMGGAFISLWLSKRMAIWMMRIKVIKPKDDRQGQVAWLYDEVRSCARRAGLKIMPSVGIYDSEEVNAFATGPSKRNALLAFSTGLLTRMDERSIRGVVAHEVGHVAGGDMVTITLIQGVLNAFVLFFARIIGFLAAKALARDEDGPSIWVQMGVTFLFDMLLGLLASLVVLWFSRRREFRADAQAARYAGKETVLDMLKGLRRYENMVEVRGGHASVSSFKIAGKRKHLRLFATHPPLEDRIAALERRNIA